MKKLNKKSLVLLVCVALLLTCAVGSTVAYLKDKTDSITNTFTPAEVTTEIVEGFDEDVKSNVGVKNTGTVPVYVRVAVIGNWCDENGNVVAPWTDNISYNTTNWKKVDGYYYYMGVLNAGASTPNLFDSYTYKDADIPAGADHLVLTVLHQSIQAEPDAAIKDKWGSDAYNAVKGGTQ